jgi:hypothetical protein
MFNDDSQPRLADASSRLTAGSLSPEPRDCASRCTEPTVYGSRGAAHHLLHDTAAEDYRDSRRSFTFQLFIASDGQSFLFAETTGLQRQATGSTIRNTTETVLENTPAFRTTSTLIRRASSLLDVVPSACTASRYRVAHAGAA